MSVKLYQKCIITPFIYDENNYEKLDNQNIFGETFVRKEFKSSAYNSLGKKLLTEEGREENDLILKRFRLSDKGRKACGLCPNKKYLYQLKTGSKIYSFQIGEIELWIFKSGCGFLTMQIKNQFENIEKALELHSMGSFFSKKDIQWGKKESKDKELVLKVLKLEKVIEKCYEFIKTISLVKQTSEDKYSISLMLTEEKQEGVSEERLQKFCLQEMLGRGSVNRKKVVNFYNYCQYIQWAVSNNAVVVWVDGHMAGKDNKQFVETGFPYSVFNNYLAVYLFYLSEWMRCDKLEAIARRKRIEISSEERKQFSKIDSELRPLAEEKYKQIDILFREILCEKQWNLSQRLKELYNNRPGEYDVFISYRHDGGQYFALLLFNYLTEKGISVFWDKDSLRAGIFEEQIYKVLDECRNVLVVLSPGCIARLQNEDDWVRKELSYAFKKKRKVLMVSMEGVEFPKQEDKSILPEEINELVNYHGIEARVASFDSDIDTIIKAMDDESIQK